MVRPLRPDAGRGPLVGRGRFYSMGDVAEPVPVDPAAIDWPASLPVEHPHRVEHRSMDELLAGLDSIRGAPADGGRVELIVRRPAIDEREVLPDAVLDPSEGLVGDTWRQRPSSRTADGSAHPEMQLNIMSARVAALVAVDPARRCLAGDQLYLDLDLSVDNLPPGTRLEIGDAVIEITQQPHQGCAKFAARFGSDALRFVNSAVGRELNLRGVNAKVVAGGRIAVGDIARKSAAGAG